MKKVSDDVLNKIKEEKLCPKAKWKFCVRDAAVWTAFAVSVIIGSFAFSAMLYRLTNEDWEIYSQLGRGPIDHFFMSLPYIWIVLVVFFIMLALYYFKHTKHGYSHKPLIIIGSSVIVALVGGALLFMFGCGQQVDKQLSDRKPFIGPRMQMWQNPEQGLLAGEILEIIEDPKQFRLLDFSDKEWQVNYEVEAAPPIKIQKGLRVKIIGQQESDDLFQAQIIKPWRHAPGPIPRGKMIRVK
ncbi:hypothetical protein ACFL2B_01090 [Patescibacteria group bacterium]